MNHVVGSPCRNCWHKLADHVEAKCLFGPTFYEAVTVLEVAEAIEVHQTRDFLASVREVELIWSPVLIPGWDYVVRFDNGGTTRGFLERRELEDIIETRKEWP